MQPGRVAWLYHVKLSDAASRWAMQPGRVAWLHHVKLSDAAPPLTAERMEMNGIGEAVWDRVSHRSRMFVSHRSRMIVCPIAPVGSCRAGCAVE